MPTQLIGPRLKALRDSRGLNQEAVADIFGFKDRQTVSAIENGDRRLSADELVRLVDALQVPLEYFTDPYRLEGEGSFSWRRSQDVPIDTLESYEKIAGRWIAAFRVIAPQVGGSAALLRHRLPLTKLSSFEEAMEAGERFVDEYQLGDVPADALAKVMEEKLGILTLMVDGREGISGAACRLPEIDAVLINRYEVAGRRHFDLAHELFHILTWDAMPPEHFEDAEARGRRSRVEQLADNFASAVLMPRRLVADVDWKLLIDGNLIGTINGKADELKVSSLALKWRLVALDLLKRSQAQAISDAALRHNGRVAPADDVVPPLFSHRFMIVLGSALDAGLLSLRRAAGLLDIDIDAMMRLFAEHGLEPPDEM
jgi:transcriptional regulator with XRE-family HTH domain/Zn-dependent peptidase ImmA (M78 family)